MGGIYSMKGKTTKEKAGANLIANEKEIVRGINQANYKIKTAAGVESKNIDELIN